MRNRKLLKLLAILLAFTLVAAACGGDDDDEEGTTTSEDDDGGGALTEQPESEPEPEPEPEPADDGEEMTDDGGDDGEEMTDDDGGGEAVAGTTDDAVQGDGATMWEGLVDNPPGAADESLEPVVITMANLEGSPAGSFPEIREGAEAAVKAINEKYGGVNGRPVELEVCVHGLDANEATNCANEIADTAPNLHIQGIDFFNPLMWPTFVGAGIPVMQTVPIFISDFDTQGLISTEGGCVTAFPGGAQHGVEILESDAIAVIHSDTGPGFECFQDTQARFYQQLEDERGDFKWAGFPDASGDPTDNDAVVQNVAEFLEGAENPSIFFGIQASDCNEILSALAAADVQATIVASGSCRDDSVLANPASVGAYFGGTDQIFERPDLWTEYQVKSFDEREANLDDRPNQDAPKSSFMEVAHDVAMTAFILMLRAEEAGVSIDDNAAFLGFIQEQSNLFRVGGANGQDCTTNTSEFESVCQKIMNQYLWDGEQFQYGPNGDTPVDVTDLLGRTAEGNARPTAE